MYILLQWQKHHIWLKLNLLSSGFSLYSWKWLQEGILASLMDQWVKNLPAMQETQVLSLGQEDPLEKEKQHTPVFFPVRPHRLQSMESERIGHNWAHKHSIWDIRGREEDNRQENSHFIDKFGRWLHISWFWQEFKTVFFKLYSHHWVKERIKKGIRKYFDMNEMKAQQDLWHTANYWIKKNL